MIFPEFPRLWRIFGVPPHFNCRPTPSFKAVQLVRVVAKAEGDAPVRPGGVGEIDHRFLGKPSRKPYKTPCPYLNNSWIIHENVDSYELFWTTKMNIAIWLVVEPYPSENYEFVSSG